MNIQLTIEDNASDSVAELVTMMEQYEFIVINFTK